MKITHLFSLSLMTVALTACGGGGGGGSDSPKENKPINQPTVTKPNQPDTQTQPEPAKPKEKAKVNGYALKEGLSFTNETKSNELDTINVWSKEIPLADPLIVPKLVNGWKVYELGNDEEKRKKVSVLSDFLTYSKIGSVVYQNTNYDFAHGFETEEKAIPNTGTIRYAGKHFFTFKDETEHKKDPTKPVTSLTVYDGEASFDANFDTKRLTGSLNIVDEGLIQFNAEINGNSFKTGFNFDDVTAQGKFYGPNAEELAGVYRKGDNMTGGFGAKKVENPKQ